MLKRMVSLLDRLIAAYFAAHGGTVERTAALAMGLSADEIDTLVAKQRWVVIAAGVYAPAEHTATSVG